MTPKELAQLQLLKSCIHPAEGDWEFGSVGPYSLFSLLGIGGMAVVFLALHRETGKRVALKCIRPDLLVDAPENYIARFADEVAMMKRVKSDFFVQVSDQGVHRHPGGSIEIPYFCMEFVSGRTLEQKLKEWEGCLPQREVARIGAEVASGLSDMHAMDYCHRDLSTNNILLDTLNFEKVRITDFGLAFLMTGADRRLSIDRVVGTKAYVAPERWKDNRNITPRGDLFSLGCVLYRALTGSNAFPNEDRATLEKNPRGLLDIAPHTDRALAILIMQLLEKEPAERPKSAEHVRLCLDLLGHSLVDKPSARSDDWPYPTNEDIRLVLRQISGRTFGIPAMWTRGPAGLLMGLASQAQMSNALMDACGGATEELTFLAFDTFQRQHDATTEQWFRTSLAAKLERFRETAVTAATQARGLPKFAKAIDGALEIFKNLHVQVNDELDKLGLKSAPDWGNLRELVMRAAKGLSDRWQEMLTNHQLVNDLLMAELDRFDAPKMFQIPDIPIQVSSIKTTPHNP